MTKVIDEKLKKTFTSRELIWPIDAGRTNQIPRESHILHCQANEGEEIL
jgi:hypothetical protein